MVKRPNQKKTKNVTKLKNEYVRTLQHQEELKKAKKVRLYRRLAVLAVLVVISFGVLTNIFFNQKKVLAAKEKEKQILIAELNEEKEKHFKLTKQLENLNNDDYIAKLARQEYFLSDEHEIIFSIPKKEAKVKKNDGEKE